ncbi:hypothetical protein [Oscillibacter sp.]|uniref:hypothetical protein n=1 Tax=Oscillibacter sp. TaxID=1945593 RepID=UPI0028A2C213|nr:hypothetical protein [Oscillibacter sp.]
MESIIVALITGGLALIGVIISNNAAANRTQTQISTAQAVTDTKLEELTREVRLHNNFAQRIPVIEEQMKVVNHRVEDLEKADKQ